jgi:DnaA family protein
VQQLVFELAAPQPPTLDNFVRGRNGEVLAALEAIARAPRETSILVWGAPAAGKTHLLAACVARAIDCGRSTRLLDAVEPFDVDASMADIVALDRIDAAQPETAARAFTLYNRLRERGGTLIAASRTPIARLPLREDLRTRLGSGLVYEVEPLSDDEKRAALAAYAHERGFALAGDVLDYLLRHGRRDMASLIATVDALDRASLASKRPASVQMLREWLQKELEWSTPPKPER